MNLREKSIYIPLIILFLGFLNLKSLSAQDPIVKVKEAFRKGNAEMLEAYFNSTVTVDIGGNERELSATETREKLETFFESHKVKNFSVKFEGEKSSSNFIIGTLYTDSGSFRINIFFRKTGTEALIHLLRIEKENESEF